MDTEIILNIESKKKRDINATPVKKFLQLKLALEIEYNIYKSDNKEKYFLKYKFVYDNI